MANASSDIVSEISDLLTCSLCKETLYEPRVLPCLHNFCKTCLEKYVDRRRGGYKSYNKKVYMKVETFRCPTCSSEFTLKLNQDVADMASNYFIKSMLEIRAIQRQAKASAACSRCEDPATNHCATCAMFMCEKCSQSHDSWLKNHSVLSIQQLINPESQVKMRNKLYCMKHADKILEYYCETCKELSCIDCMVLNHIKQNHSCVAVSEVAVKQKKILQSSCATLDETLTKGKQSISTICEVMKSLKENAKTAKDQIKKQKESIVKIVVEKIEERAKEMYAEVDKVYGDLHSELSKQHDEVKSYLNKVQGSVSLPKNLLKKGSIEEIISSQSMIDDNVERLKNEQPENMDAVNDGSVKFVPEKSDLNVDEIVNKFGYVDGSFVPGELRMSSSILKGEISFMKQLQKWLGRKFKWHLCYRASRDGWRTFHQYCDNKGPTVVLVKANNCIFGGFTDQSWHGSNRYECSNSSFLFSLRNKDNLAPFIANVKQGGENYAICCSSSESYGPVFGRGHDLYICSNPQVNQSYSDFGHTYQLPPGYAYGCEQTKNLLAGQFYFQPTEIEVFN